MTPQPEEISPSSAIIQLPSNTTPPSLLAQVLAATEGAESTEILALVNKVVDKEYELREQSEKNRHTNLPSTLFGGALGLLGGGGGTLTQALLSQKNKNRSDENKG